MGENFGSKSDLNQSHKAVPSPRFTVRLSSDEIGDAYATEFTTFVPLAIKMIPPGAQLT